ncbi:MAG TPA: cupredoxin domain-containing protein [Actinomycetes bacterium]|jgi:uncharacterized cupredoxin-like copper-binding protein|nr:cupredoxin domain-containing protein [Actinomycetes bacterium]
MKRMRVIVGIVMLSLAAAACGGRGGEVAGSGAASPAGQANASQAGASEAATVSAVLKDFSIAPTVASVPAGKVAFHATNQGPSEHEFVVLKTNLAPESLPVKGGVVTEDAKGIENVGELEELGSGATKSTTINLTPGRYLLVCNLPGHYQAGMVASFVVT